MNIVIQGYDVDDPETVVGFYKTPAFYKGLLEVAGRRYNRQYSPTLRIGWWNLAVGTKPLGKIWNKKGNLKNTESKFRMLLNYTSELTNKTYYEFEINNSLVEDNKGNEIFRNMVRFTLNDFHHAIQANGEITVISENGAALKLSDYLPYHYQISQSNGSFLHQNPNEHQITFFVDMDYPQNYFELEGGEWVKKDIPRGELKGYERLYWINNDQIHTGKLRVPKRRSLSGGRGGGGAMRADKVDEVDYLWSGNKAIGLALGLKKDYYLDDISANQVPEHYWELTPLMSGNKETDIAMVRYFKRFETTLALGSKKNKPENPMPPKVFSFQDVKKLQDSKYYYSSEFFKLRQKGKEEAKAKGWEGLPLQHTNTRDRDTAGAVMGASLSGHSAFTNSYNDWRNKLSTPPAKPPAPNSNVSANHFTDFLLDTVPEIKKEWSDLKNDIYKENNIRDQNREADWNKRRTDQEWCHLFGHGDGGLEEWGNFVAGSKHCNTTQLAIESGQRKGKHPGLSVKVSAYLFEHYALQEAINFEGLIPYLKVNLGWNGDAINDLKSYLYADGSNNYPELPISLGKDLIAKIDKTEDAIKLFEKLFIPYPLARLIHYKITYRSDNNSVIDVLDYFFDAQSESFDYNEFKILQNMVVFAIADARSRGIPDNSPKPIDEYYKSIEAKLLIKIRREELSQDDFNMLKQNGSFKYQPLDEDGEGLDSSVSTVYLEKQRGGGAAKRNKRGRPGHDDSKKARTGGLTTSDDESSNDDDDYGIIFQQPE